MLKRGGCTREQWAEPNDSLKRVGEYDEESQEMVENGEEAGYI